MSPFEQVLGERFHLLPPQVRQLHGTRAPRWTGKVSVSVASNPFARLAARFIGFPDAMDKAPFSLTLTTRADGCEEWRRDFNGVETISVLYLSAPGVLQESFGPITLELLASVKVDSLHCKVSRAWLFGKLPLPSVLTPCSDVKIWQDEAGRYRFDIAGSLPGLGQIVRYEGWLLPGA